MASSASNLHAGMSNMSVHSDILSADIPSDPTSKAALVSELKNRAKVSIQSRNYPAAEMLYGKAIAVMEEDGNDDGDDDTNNTNRELSILYANRALAWLQMNQAEKSLRDAERATSLDATYVKGFWRRGQALVALQRYPEATGALESAVALDPSNKALVKEVQKCRGLVKMKVKVKDDDDTKEANGCHVAKKTTATATVQKTSNNTNSTSKDSSMFSESDHVRGYKIVDGKKTSFFHHEQTEEEKRLIGDIAPKRINTTATTTSSNNNNNTNTNNNTSAWNKAGTWEERDVTSWATDTLRAQCLLARYELPASSPVPGSVVTISKVKRAHGHASVATARGKRRYIYELGVELEWSLTLVKSSSSGDNSDSDGNDGGGNDNTTVIEGTMSFPDIDGTCDVGEYEMTNYKVTTTTTPASARHLLDRFVRNGGLKDEVVTRIDEWVELMKSTH